MEVMLLLKASMRSMISPTHKFILIVFMTMAVLLSIGGCARQSSRTPGQSLNNKPVQQNIKPEDKVKPKDSSTKPLPKPVKVDNGPKLSLTQEGVTLSWMENGKKRMSARASQLKGDEVTRTGAALNFYAELYENGKLTATMTAPKAVADTQNQVVTATGGVTLKSLERKTIIKSSWMKWYSKKHKIVGNGGVKITSTMGTINAAAFVADTDLKSLTVKDSAKGLVE